MARLTIHADIDCNIYVDTEYYGIANADTDYSIELCDGAYWIECRSVDDNIPLCDFDFNAYGSSVDVRKDVSLLNSLRHNRLKVKYDTIGEFVYGYARVQNKGMLIGYIDSTYQLLYDDVRVLSDNVLCVKKNGMYGVLNDGKEIISIKYASITILGNKLLRLELNNHFGLANLNGQKLTPLKYTAIEYVKNDVYALYFNGWSFVNCDINTIDTPSNVLLYSTNDNKPLTIERDISYENRITYDAAFKQHPFLHKFQNGEGLIVFDNCLDCIGKQSFYGCRTLTSVTIPDSVKSIEEGAFEECINMACINIPKNVKTIDGSVFCHCLNLSSIEIPHSLETISEYSFYGCSKINNIVIPDGITTIEKFAFKGCESLTTINIPQSVASVGESAFEGCDNLQEVHITSIEAWCNISFVYNGEANPLHNAKAHMYINGALVQELIIPDGVEEINEYAFYGGSGFTRIIIPNSVTTINDYAFWGCKYLKEINIPENVNSIGIGAFAHCSSLVKTIIPHSVEDIGECAFSGCTGTLYINCDIPACFPVLHEYYDESYSGVSIAEMACSFGGADFSEIHIGRDVATIGGGAFKGCNNIIKFDGKFVEDNGRCIIIEDELIAVATSGLTEYRVPDEVKQIGEYAFDNSKGLVYITLPQSVETICGGAFYNCDDLITIFCESSTPAELQDFYGLYSMNSYMMPNPDGHFGYWLRNICVPKESVDIYRNEWNEYEDKIVGYNF